MSGQEKTSKSGLTSSQIRELRRDWAVRAAFECMRATGNINEFAEAQFYADYGLEFADAMIEKFFVKKSKKPMLHEVKNDGE